MKAIAIGSYALHKSKSNEPTETFDLKTNVERLQESTLYYGPESEVSSWSTLPSANTSLGLTPTKIWATEQSTLDTARDLVKKFGTKLDSQLVDGGNTAASGQGKRAHAVGVLNFASAKNPGGGFLNGARAQVGLHTVYSLHAYLTYAIVGRVNRTFIDSLSKPYMPHRPTVLHISSPNHGREE